MRNLKKVLALVLAMAMSLSLAVTAGAAYKDSDKISAEYEVAVEVASQLGILEGFEDGSYGPQKTLTRAQLATMTYRLATADVDDVYTANFAGGAADAFTDTAATAWYAGYVGYAADAGFLKGCGEGLYKPNSALTGYQALAAFLRVIGYNEPGQFTGSDWTVQVAQIATQNGFLKGIENVDLAAPISREVAAQIIYNALFAQVVTYTPAFGYQLSVMKNPIADDLFDIDTGKKGVVQPTAPWGQPATEWEDKDGDVVVSIPFAPVAEYTVAVDECDLAKDLGVTKKTAPAKEYKNGAIDDSVVTANVDPLDTVNTVGAQGTLTEVYEVEEDEYWFVQIETWLGQIGKTTEAEIDKNGHVEKAATAELTVFECDKHDATVTIETDEYAEDEYVLINYSFMDDEDDKDYGFYLTATAPVDTAKVTEIDRDDKQTTVGGTTYDWAVHYHEGQPAIAGVEYNVFEDFYGNLIALIEPADPDPVYTIMSAYTHYTDGFKANYDAAEIVNLTSGALEEVVVDTVDGSAPVWGDDVYETVRKIFEVTSDEDGYDFTRPASDVLVADTTNYSIVKGTPRIVAGGQTFVSDAETVYAVETEWGVYDIYTGYTNVPTVASLIGDIEILDEDKDGYADLVYVDATASIFAGEEVFAYVLPGAADIGGGVLADDTKYEIVADVVIDGEIVKVLVQDGKEDIVTGMAGKFVTLKADADGLIYAADDSDDALYIDGKVAKENHKEVVYLDTTDAGYVVTADTVIWVFDADGNVALGTADDISEVNADITYKLASNGRDVEFVVVW